MKFRELGGIVIVMLAFFFSGQNPPDDGLPKPPTPAEQAKMDRANLPLQRGPTMQMLIMLSGDDEPKESREYYQRVLGEALKITGPIQWNLLELDQRVFYAEGHARPTANKHYATISTKSFSVLVPVSLLPAIRPDDRGYSFPENVPFVPLQLR